WLCSCWSVAQHVTHTAHCMDQRGSEALVDFVAKRVDVHVDDIAHAVEVNVPDMLHNHGAGYCAMGVPKKEFKKRVLLHLQIDHVSRAPHLAGRGVHFEIGDRKPGVLLRASP